MHTLKEQMRALREMLRESHKVMKHLVSQEQLLKDELKQASRVPACWDPIPAHPYPYPLLTHC